MARFRDVGLPALGAALAVLAARAVLYRAAAHRFYSGEATGVGRLQWEISQGHVPWQDPATFVVDHTYQYFAQGTVLLQAVAWLLSPVFGPTLTAQVAAATLLEAAGVACFAAAVARTVSARAAAVAVLPLVFAPEFVSTFAIQPYGNHTEFVWVGTVAAFVFAAGRAPADRSWPGLLALAALLGLGCVLYRLNVVVAIAAVATLAAGRGGLRAVPVAAVAFLLAAGTFTWLGLSPLGWSESLDSFPAAGPRWAEAPDALAFLWERGLDAVRVGPDGGRLHRVVLLSAVAGATAAWWRDGADDGRGELARFAALWALGSLALPVVSGSALPRYFIPAWTACNLCLAVHLGSERLWVRRGAGAALGLTALLGLVQVAPLVLQGQARAPLPRADLWWFLEVDTLDRDEQPYYHRLIDEGRGSRWVGLPSHSSSNLCPRWPGTESPRDPDDLCAGWEQGELARLVVEVARQAPPEERVRALTDIGRGIWIRANRSVEAVARAVEGAPPEFVEPVLAGARDEAERQGARP